MFKIRRTAAIAAGALAVAALAIGGTAAPAAGAADPAPSPSATDDRGGAVQMLPDGDPVPGASSDEASPRRPASSPAAVPPAASARPITVEHSRIATTGSRNHAGGRDDSPSHDRND